MREMKDSNFEWIGKIPNSWGLIRLKYLCNIQTGNQDTQDADPDGQYDFYVRSPIIEKSNKYTFDGEGILMAGDGAGAGRIFHYACGKYAVHQRVYRISNFKRINSKYLYYYSSNVFPNIMDMGSAQSTVPSVRLPMLLNFNVCIPPIAEQCYIADYLDTRCSQIDSIRKNVEAEIEALKQYKQSVITEAVTKGLDRNVEMKDSGIPWIGKIPKNWKITRLKYLGNYRNGLTYSPINICSENDGVLVLRSSNVQNGKIDLKDNVYVNIPIRSDMMVRYGDILICSRNGSKTLIGKNAIIDSNINASFGAFMMIYRCIDSRYLYYILNSSVFSYYIGSFFTSTINQLTGTNFGNIKIPFCPEQDERLKIITYLDSKCAKIDSIIQKKQELLANLDTYKKSLIYEYVTGKKEVPAV